MKIFLPTLHSFYPYIIDLSLTVHFAFTNHNHFSVVFYSVALEHCVESEAFGMTSGGIPNTHINASSNTQKREGYKGRLFQDGGKVSDYTIHLHSVKLWHVIDANCLFLYHLNRPIMTFVLSSPSLRLLFLVWQAESNNYNQYLQINLGEKKLITSVATQGYRGSGQFVIDYHLMYSNDGDTYVAIVNDLSEPEVCSLISCNLQSLLCFLCHF